MSQSPRPLEELVLREYQRVGFEQVINELEVKGLRSTLVEWCTGGGKTCLMAKLAERNAANGQRTLILANLTTLVKQARDKIQRFTTLKVGVERANLRAVASRHAERAWLLRNQPVVVASVQTLQSRPRLEMYDPNEFGMVILDEAHHALAPKTRDTLNYFRGAKIVGVTATADRADGKSLGQVFESAAHRYSIQEGIADGHLAQIRQHAVYVKDLDFSKVRESEDLNGADLERIMVEERHLQAIAGPIFELSGDRPTLTFAASREHAKLLADQLKRRAAAVGNPWKRAEYLTGECTDSECEDTIAAFERGEFQHLVGCMKFTEGFDVPRIACVAVARPTLSRSLYVQMIGRGTRLSPDTGKADCLVLDFKGNAGRHSLVSMPDVLAGDMTPVLREEIEKVSLERPRLTYDEMAEIAKQRLAAKLAEERALAARREIIAQSRHVTREIDPFAIVGFDKGANAPKQRDGGGPAKKEQLEALANEFRFFGGRKMSQTEAGQLLTRFRRAKREGRATWQQIKHLTRFNVNAQDMSVERATRLIDAISKNGGAIPAGALERQPGED